MAVRAPANQAPAIALDSAASAIASARRAVLADRYAANSFSVEWRDLAQLAPIVDEWRTLATRALEPNVFYEPAFALAAAPVLGRDAGAVLVWSGTEPRRLLGSFLRASKSGVTASSCRSLSAGRIPTRRSACRWSSARRPSRSRPPGWRTSPPMRRCRDCCCCPMCRSTVRSPRRSRQSAGARRCRPPISIAMSGLSWRRAANGRITSSRRLASTTIKSCAGAGGV